MTQNASDLIILGAGPGGYVAAIRAAQLGMKVTIVEANHLGGICLNWGCIPTKALLRSAEVLHLAKHAESYGITVQGVSFDVKKIAERSRAVAKQLSSGIGHLMKKNKVTVVDGWGKIAGPGKVTVEKDGKKIADLTAKHIIIATGARARVLPGLEPDGKRVWSYREAMVPTEMPKSVLVVGSGAIGIEFASFYRTLGADVTVVEVMDRVVPAEDPEISGLARKAFEKQGMKILTGAKVVKLDRAKDHVTATIEISRPLGSTQGPTDKMGPRDKPEDLQVEKITVTHVISAVGVVSNTENIGLETVPRVKLDRGCIVVDPYLATGQPGIYAIGDVTPGPWLAHKASHEGIICVEKIAGLHPHPINRTNIPGCTYCHPQIASVGYTEEKAKAAGHTIKVGRFPFIGNGKAIALGEPEGLVKTVFDAKTGELLGAHMIGAEVTELIQGFVIGKTAELVDQDFMHTVFPHPTLSEMMHEAVLATDNRAVHY
jgi:dihydrolipoamide dehydrogenase